MWPLIKQPLNSLGEGGEGGGEGARGPGCESARLSKLEGEPQMNKVKKLKLKIKKDSNSANSVQ